MLVEPFGVIGKRDAQDYCQEVPLAALPTIPHLPGFDPNQGVIHQLWCNTDTCAVLQAGAASAVPKSAIARTISPPLSQRLPGKPDTPHPTMCSPESAPADNKPEDGGSSPLRPDRAAMHAVRFLAAIALSASHLPATQASSVNSPEKWNPGMDLNASRNALTQFLKTAKARCSA